MEQGEVYNGSLKEGEGAGRDLPMPEITVGHERGPILFSLAQAGLKPNGITETGHPFAQHVRDAFTKQPVPVKLMHELESFHDFDSETRLRLSFAIDHPERMETIRRELLRDKPVLQERVAEFEAYVQLLEQFSQYYGELKNSAGHYAKEDAKARLETLPEVKRRLTEAKDFFKPAKGSAGVEKVVLLPTDPLESARSGVSIEIGSTTYISSHRDNIGNQTHEFLHSIVNPMVDRLALAEEQKKRVVEQASSRLKHDQGYGENYSFLLYETLIRTYVDYWSKGERMQSEELFRQQVQSMTPDQFVRSQEDVRERERMVSLGINSLEDFKRDGWKQYFERYVRDPLGERVQKLYEKYSEQRLQTPSLRFEQFLIEHIEDLVK